MVNNAGYGQIGTLEELSDEETRQNFEVNVFGVLNVIRAAMPHFRERKAGHVINISSIAGLVGTFAGFGIYSATKFAVVGLTEALSAEAQEFGLKATVVYPGYFRTSFLENDSIRLAKNRIGDYTAARNSEVWHEKEMKGHQPGNPDLAADVLIQLAEAEQPPLHFFMGSDSFGMAKGKVETLESSLTAHEELSHATDF